MRSTAPRMRTVSCAETGRSMQMEKKLAAASTRRAMPDMDILPVFEWLVDGLVVEANAVYATPGGQKYSLFRLDAGVLDHLAPARFLDLKIAIERLRRLRDHDEALVDAEFFESLGLDGFCGRFVETVDDVRRGLGRRIQAIPGFRRIAGNSGFRNRRQLREGRRAFRRRHGVCA